MSYFDENDKKEEDGVIPMPQEPQAPAEAEAPAETEAPAEDEAAEEAHEEQAAFAAAFVPVVEYKEKKKKTWPIVVVSAVLALALLGASFFGGLAIAKRMLPSLPSQGQQGGGGGNTPPAIDRGDVYLNVVESVAGLAQTGSVPAVVEAVEKTVVEIRVESMGNDPVNGNYVQRSAGSGVIIHQDGLVLTCHHMIEDAQTITVTTTDGKNYEAKLLGTDRWSDLALLKIEGSNFSYATLAKAPEGEGAYAYMKLGETVVAIGNALGELGGSVSVGVVSSLGREMLLDGMPMTLLQTDAALNPGTSGGGLFNLRGELIGIINSKSTGDSVEGIGYAVPSTDALDIVAELYKQGYVSGRPYLGMYFNATGSGLQIVSYEFSSELPNGQTVEKGDYVQSIDGMKISSMSNLRTFLSTKKPGDVVTMKVSRLVGAYGYQSRYETVQLTLIIHEEIPNVEA